MNNKYESWKRYVLQNELTYRIEDNEALSNVLYIGDTKVYLYSEKNYSAGIWIQSNDCKLRIYVRNEKGEHIIWRSFNGNHEEGPIHQHDFIEIGYVVEGCACQSFFGKEYKFHQGDFWLVDRNCYHSDKYRQENLFTVYIGIPTDIFDSALVESVGNNEIQKFLSMALLQSKKNRQFLHFIPCKGITEGEILMEQLLREIIEQKVGYHNISKGLLARLLNSLSSTYDFQLTCQDKRKISDLIFCEVEKFLQENYKTATIGELVRRFHYNADFYNRLIKEYSGYTYSDYLKNIRLKEAEKMIRTTKLSIVKIGNQVGYQSMGHFYQLFQKKYGMTPAKYRKQSL